LRGGGPAAVITDLGIYEPHPATHALRLTALQPGATVEQARAATGWDLDVAPELAELEPPAPAELAVLRSFPAARNAAR
jgi:glutaconate CoA-transferase subunit B